MTYKQLTAQTPNFADLTGGQPHKVSRHKINVKLVKIARADLGLSIVERYFIPDEKVRWDIDVPEYAPPFIDIPRGDSSFRKKGDHPDPVDPNEIENFASLETNEVQRDVRGFPLNPVGRTGLRGRGMLDKWGATQAADPILTRNNPETGNLEVLLIERGDTHEWGFPGGKIDDGEEPWQAAGRELIEEAGVSGAELDFSAARTVFAGYVDDSRNTDNAWMESTALHLHLDPKQARAVTIAAGSDADKANWAVVNEGLYTSMFASHGQCLRLALEGK